MIGFKFNIGDQVSILGPNGSVPWIRSMDSLIGCIGEIIDREKYDSGSLHGVVLMYEVRVEKGGLIIRFRFAQEDIRLYHKGFSGKGIINSVFKGYDHGN